MFQMLVTGYPPARRGGGIPQRIIVSSRSAPACQSCRKGRYAPPVHMIKLTEKREITPYRWVHPDEER